MLLLAALLLGCKPAIQKPAPAKARAEHVVICIWDGMRPDFVTASGTPTLHALAQSGTFFTNNHSQYITTTEVNGTVLATGVFPARSGIIANREFRREINPLASFATESVEAIRKGDELTGGKYLGVSTIAETVQKAGFSTAVSGTKPVALLQDRFFGRSGTRDSLMLFAGKSQSPAAFAEIVEELGPFPPLPSTDVTVENVKPNSAQDTWTTRALTEVFWKNGVPKLSILWLNEPDFSQHMTAPGSAAALAGIANCDASLAAVLSTLETKGIRDKTDIFVVSDHGFSTVAKMINLVAKFKAMGIPAGREFKWAPAPGEVLVVNTGGSVCIYVAGHVSEMIQKVVDLLQSSDFAGPIFTKDPLPGTFSLKDAHLDSANAPDVVFSFRALPGPNQFGTPGLIYGELERGFGTHGTLGKADVNNLLIAAGPDIRAGFRDLFPSGNIDVAPTVLHLLGIKAPEPLDGRVLMEALAAVEWDAPKPQSKRMEATRQIGALTWRQFIQTTEFAGHSYLDEGNASLEK
ncbi:MAG: Type phosphodiesterase/nucleotide pyrophosphatase [Chthoniobacteraceae bacterium]|nr:Type phosphodiesterase/nucleotide pyrophosphatase [Chthoniobacteraceae bacterium]